MSEIGYRVCPMYEMKAGETPDSKTCYNCKYGYKCIILQIFKMLEDIERGSIKVTTK